MAESAFHRHPAREPTASRFGNVAVPKAEGAFPLALWERERVAPDLRSPAAKRWEGEGALFYI